MNKIKPILLKQMLIFSILIFSLFNSKLLLAQDLNIKESYKMLEFYCYKLGNEDTAYKYKDKLDDIMDYAVEILKKAPESCQAAGATITYMMHFNFINDEAQKKYEKLYEKYMNDFESTDINIETAEKLFFLMTYLGHVAFSSKLSEEENENNWNKCKNVLKKIKNECNNEAFRALATLIMASIENKVDYLYEFLEKYPKHPIIPSVKLSVITTKYDLTTEMDKYKSEVEKLMSEYKDTIDASGYTFDVNCYEALAGAYLQLNDKTSAQKYIDIIKIKTPQNPMLNEYKEMMSYKTLEEVKKMMKKK